MTETQAQKRERILRSERTHADGILPLSIEGFQAAISPSKPPGEAIDAPLHKLLACPNDWIAGRGGPISLYVVHCTASTNPASSTANFFHSCATDHGSTQYVFDDDTGFLCVPLDAICAGAPPCNQEGVHAEMPGEVGWTRATWLSHMDQLRRQAFYAAETCKENDLPVRFVTEAIFRREGEKAKGVTSHWEITKAFGQSTHTDPGPNFPWDVFMPMVKGFFDGTGGDELALTEQQQDFTVGMILALKEQAPAADAPDATKNGHDLMKARLAGGGGVPKGTKVSGSFTGTTA